MSLRLRFILLPLVVVLAGLAGFAACSAYEARARVSAQVEAGAEVGRLVAAGAIAHAAQATTPQEALDRLIRELPPSVGDLRLTVETDSQYRAAAEPPTRSRAPDWFEHLVKVPPLQERYPVVAGQAAVGSVVLVSQPDRAISDAWQHWRRQVAIVAALSAATVVAIIIAAGVALGPFNALTRAFDRLERGDLAVRVKPGAGRQMRRLAERFNRLAALLQQADAEHRRLVDEVVSVQDVDRKDIARELHDGYGPPLFAIRSDLGALSRWVRKKEPRFEEIEERLLSISSLVAQIQRINSQLVDRLRR